MVNIHIYLNGKLLTLSTSTIYDVLRNQHHPEADQLIVNGHACPWSTLIRENDSVLMINSKTPLERQTLRALYDMRYGPELMDKITAAKVAICGLGGLGSLVALELARLGVGKLLLIDFDRVEPTNLARQQYLLSHLGLYKTEALADLIQQCGSLSEVQIETVKLNTDNISVLLNDYPIICEALDKAESKAMLINTVLSQLPASMIVSGNGMAGYDSGNLITTKKITSRLYITGDGMSEGHEGIGLMAPRVGLCASAQATQIMRLILEQSTL